jgi:hypothetical protein
LRGVTGADETMQSRERIEDLGGERCAGEMARPERFELPTSWFVGGQSIAPKSQISRRFSITRW